MTEGTTPNRLEISTKLASARQTMALLKSQLQAGMVERDYWTARLNDIAGLLEQLAEERAAGDQQRQLAALFDVSRVLGASLDLNEVLNQVMDAIIKLTTAERGFLMLFEENGELEVKVARNVERESLSEDEFAFSQSVIRTVAETGEQVVTTNAIEDPRFAGQASVVAHNLRSIQCVPLRARGQIIGVVYVDNRIRSGVFSESDLEVLSTFAAQAAVAIENARLFTLTDEALADRVAELSIMQEIDRQLNQNLDFSNVMALTLEWATRITQARNGAIGLIDLEEAETQVVAQHGPDPARVIALLQDGIGVGGDWEITVPIQREGHVSGVVALDRADNKAFSEESRAFLVRLTDHAAVAIENARLYQQVQEANQAKTDFVHVVTHELRAPMTTIKGYADMIAMSSDLDDKQKRFLAIIRSSVERMSTLVSDLSDISRIESGKLNIEIEPHITIDECLNRVLDQLRGQIDERGHQIKTELAKGLPAVQADPKRVDQVLTNLISNAYKYTPNNGTITVSARKEGHFVRVAVSDTGVGMTPQELNRLFTKFWRADDLHVREQPGTGLGLTITKNLIEMQGGQLTVESAKGEGTTFSFTLPVSAG